MQAERCRLRDASCVNRLIVFFANRFVVAIVGAVVGSQIEPARARQCHVKAISNRSRDALGTPRDTQERPERMSGTSRERLGNVSGTSRERLGESLVRPESARRAYKGALERQR